MTKLLPEYDKGFEAMMANKENIIKSISANMTYFPLCCSTGILNGMQASEIKQHDEADFGPDVVRITSLDAKAVKKAEYIHEIIKLCKHTRIFFPVSVARWNALSKILIKVVVGTDDQPSNGYSNFKASQIMMCDRIVADKRNPKFKFNSYNIVYSIDHLMDWLADHPNMGEALVSTPKPGGHGARVRACIYTPDIEELQKYHDIRLTLLKTHVLECLKMGRKATAVEVIDKVANSW